MVIIGPVGLMKKTKVVCNHRFLLRIFFPTHCNLCKCLKKFLVGGWGGVWGGVEGFLNKVSTSGPVLSRSMLGLAKLFDQVGQA